MKWFWHRNRMESEMDEELRFHIDSYASDLMKQGIAKDEAFRRARMEFGAVEARKEECRESLGLRLWDELRSDLRGGIECVVSQCVPRDDSRNERKRYTALPPGTR